MPFDQIRYDLRFLLGKVKRPRVAWHDPNFGVRFDDYLNAIEEVVPSRRMRFVAESSLSLPQKWRMLPGRFTNKSKTGATGVKPRSGRWPST